MPLCLQCNHRLKPYLYIRHLSHEQSCSPGIVAHHLDLHKCSCSLRRPARQPNNSASNSSVPCPLLDQLSGLGRACHPSNITLTKSLSQHAFQSFSYIPSSCGCRQCKGTGGFQPSVSSIHSCPLLLTSQTKQSTPSKDPSEPTHQLACTLLHMWYDVLRQKSVQGHFYMHMQT
jgi:hypothetical protein